MIKPITFQGTVNFKASLYALEVRSRFIDQTHANGFYKNYGQELNKVNVTTSSITIGTGAFLVQGRMMEITSNETVSIPITKNYKGYIIVSIETYQLNQENNCKLTVKTASSFAMLDAALIQEDTYSYDADTSNKKYEYPIYSFEIDENSSITNVTKLIEPIDDYNKVYEYVKNALKHMDDLEQQIVEKQGTKVSKNGQYIGEYVTDNVIESQDKIRISGGNSSSNLGG